MALVDSANVACGEHAGDTSSMVLCLNLARRHGVRVGAHPGWPSANGFGRDATLQVTPEQLTQCVRRQWERLHTLAHEQGTPLSHVKLHGALYHASDADETLARACVAAVAGLGSGLVLFARAGGLVAREARRQGVEVWEEAFLDRGYRDDGTLVPRGLPGDLLHRVEDVSCRVSDLQSRGGLRSVGGAWVHLEPRTLCVHADTPAAVAFLAAARTALRRSRTPRPSGRPS